MRFTAVAILGAILATVTQANAQTVVDAKKKVVGTATQRGNLIIKINNRYYEIRGVNRQGFPKVRVNYSWVRYYYATTNCSGAAYVDLSDEPTAQDDFIQPASVFGISKNPNNNFYYSAAFEYVSTEPPIKLFQYKSSRYPQDLDGECSPYGDQRALELAGKIVRSTLTYSTPFATK